MSWNGSGTFTRTLGSAAWTGDAAAGTKIVANRHDTNDTDLATGINNCVAKDGQNAFTGTTGGTSLRGAVDNTSDLGSATLRWRNLYAGTSVVFQGATYASTVTATPTANRALALPDLDGTVGLAGISLAALSSTGTSTMTLVASGLSSPGYSKIVINFEELSLSGTNDIIVQFADLSGFLTSGYNGYNCISTNAGNTLSSSTAGIPISLNGAAQTINGSLTLTRSLSSSLPGADFWFASGVLWPSGATNVETVTGYKQLTVGTPKGKLDGLRLRSSGGAQTFDAGRVTVTGYL